MISIVKYLSEEDESPSREQAKELLRRKGFVGGSAISGPVAMSDSPISSSGPAKVVGPVSLGSFGPSKVSGPTSLGDIKPEKVEGPTSVGFDAWQKIIKKSAQTAVENK